MTATPVAELELGAFDYTDHSLRGERFHEAMAGLRAGLGSRTPPAELPLGGGDGGASGWLAKGPFGYMVLDREAGEFFLRSRSATFPGMKIAEIFGVSEGPLYEQMKRNILHVNGPDHARLRGLVNPALSPRAVERYRPVMRQFLEQLMERALGGERSVRCEFVDAFAKPFPSLVMASVMGAPLEDAPRLHHWSNWIQRQFDAASMASERELIEQAVQEFYEYAQALLDARREHPADDLISRLIAAADPAHEPERLSDVECVNLVFNVLAGGVDTTQSQLAHAMRLLAERPEQWELLVQSPELAAAAVEEALRYEPITPFTARITTEQVVFRDVLFPPDTVVMVCTFTGNRDLPASDGGEHAQIADSPAGDEFDIVRAAADSGASSRPLTFGAGVHYCVGANLARLELTEALSFLAQRVQRVELDGDPVFGAITGISGLEQLPLLLTLA